MKKNVFCKVKYDFFENQFKFRKVVMGGESMHHPIKVWGIILQIQILHMIPIASPSPVTSCEGEVRMDQNTIFSTHRLQNNTSKY